MKINVLGSGYMGKQICSLFVALGYEVIIWQNSDENLEDFIKKEIIKIEKVLNLNKSGNFKIIRNISQLEENFTIETLTENTVIKKKNFFTVKLQQKYFQ